MAVRQYIGGLVDDISKPSWRLPAAETVVEVLHSMPMCAAGTLAPVPRTDLAPIGCRCAVKSTTPRILGIQ